MASYSVLPKVHRTGNFASLALALLAAKAASLPRVFPALCITAACRLNSAKTHFGVAAPCRSLMLSAIECSLFSLSYCNSQEHTRGRLTRAHRLRSLMSHLFTWSQIMSYSTAGFSWNDGSLARSCHQANRFENVPHINSFCCSRPKERCLKPSPIASMH